ncbi:MAG: alpha/beta hydrolase-fold protein [Bacteroidota bacterium]
MKKTALLFCVVFAFVSCKKYEFEFQGSSSETSFYSQTVDDDFNLYTYLPPDYSTNTKYPIIFLLDGNWYFEGFTKELNDLVQRGIIEPSILIGIGYQENVGEKRFRDYTFPQNLEYDIDNGQADEFQVFLKDELIPYVASEYSTDSTKYVLMGHSLGGLNTLYNMMQVNSPFSRYVAVSSSIWWNNAYLFELEERLSNNVIDLPIHAYIAVGSEEPPSMTIPNEELIERLNSRNYNSLRLTSEFFMGASHSQVPMIGFKNGIQSVLNQ